MLYGGHARLMGGAAGMAIVVAACGPAPLRAQTQIQTQGETRGEAPPPASGSATAANGSQSGDVTVTGQRIPGSVIGAVAPVAVLDAQAMEATGATSLSDLLKKVKALTSSSSGADPVMLLNGRRVSGFSEFQSLPYEAMERIEILPEQEAARFGYPPTVRVMNFITKKKFRAVTVEALPTVTTQGGGAGSYAEIGSARIDGPRRLTFSAAHTHVEPIFQSQRDIIPDPDVPFATTGNVAGAGGASLDPRLDALAGRVVTMAGVPVDPAARGTLSAYADSPAGVTDLGRYRTLQPRSDTIRAEAGLASPLGKRISGSLMLSMEANQNRGLNGLAPATLTVPGGLGVFPFAGDVRLYRYLPDSVLHQRTTGMTLHAGGTLSGDVRRWSWAVTGNYDRSVGHNMSEIGVPLGALQSAINAGGDPMAAIDPVTAAQRTVNRSRSESDTIGIKATANGPLVRLPAGQAMLTVTTDYRRVDSDASSNLALLAGGPVTGVGRTLRGASVNASVPVASAREGSLAALGELQLSVMAGVSEVSDFGRLNTSNLGLNWTPFAPVQLNASVNVTQAAPAVTQLVAPVVTTPNTPFFDYVTGRSTIVTTIFGGNPDLAPEKRRVTTLGLAVQPIKDKDIRAGVDYLDTRIDNQAASLGGATPAFQRVFPDLFVRNGQGQLVTVDLRPVNLAFERERKLRMMFSFSSPLGKSPPARAPASQDGWGQDRRRQGRPAAPAQAAPLSVGIGDGQLPAGGPADAADRGTGARSARRGDAERHRRAAALGRRSERFLFLWPVQCRYLRPRPGADPDPQRDRRVRPALLRPDVADPLQLDRHAQADRQALDHQDARAPHGRQYPE